MFTILVIERVSAIIAWLMIVSLVNCVGYYWSFALSIDTTFYWSELTKTECVGEAEFDDIRHGVAQ